MRSIGANDPNQYYWDSTADVPYLYNRNTGIFSTYEDVYSIDSKLDYVHDHGLGGMFFWEITADLPIYESDSLLQKAYKIVLRTEFGMKTVRYSSTIEIPLLDSFVIQNSKLGSSISCLAIFLIFSASF